jgi:subtilisin-like proprotein convertase family protein/protocatechuate 3,4-dioxygenase beta subunit
VSGLQYWTIFLDANDNGLLDGGEASDTTNANGNYTIPNVGPGTHRIREVQQNGWTQTTPNPADVAAQSGSNVSGRNFGNFRLITISGQKFNDLDADGVRDNNEPGLQNWTIFLDANDNGTLDGGEVSTTTNSNGNYNFPNLGPGTYRVREVQQNGWTQTTANPAAIVAQSGTDVSGVQFGNTRAVTTISGQKFEDLDGDGVKDNNEPGLQGWTIFLDADGDGTLDNNETRDTTNANGNYSFPNLTPGTYRVREVQRSGWTQTTSNPADIVANGSNVSGVDFGNFQLITISGMKFNDRDGDGVRDNNEPGLQGWTIFLDEDNDGNLDSGEPRDTTNNQGNYSFNNLGPGTYRVREVQRNGWTQTTSNPADIAARSGNDAGGRNFGNFQLVTISGQKFNDLDGDGNKDSGEPGLPNWTIRLDLDADGTVDRSTTTDNNGNYSFTNVGPGTHRVREVVQNGWTRTTPNPADISTLSGIDANNVDFGNFRDITISGQKFEDLDGDGVRDNNEPGLQNWTIFLDADGDGTLDNNETRTTTNANGNYSFNDLGPGTYRVREVQQNGWTQTTSNPADIVAQSGSNVSGVNFGNARGRTISGQKFHDLDGDGIKDNNEPGLQNWTIQLDQGANGTVDQSTTTDSNGNYSFPNLSPGTYRVREVQQGGWTQTTNNPADIVLNGSNATGVDFGNFRLISISGQKFNDLDADGFRDNNEPGLQNWTIQLDVGADGSVEQTTTTDSNGNYSFSNLGPAIYRLREVQQAGWVQTTPNPADIVATSGANVIGRDFGNTRRTTISGQKFEDRDGDGVKDNNEPGLSGWTIQLDQGANGTVDQTTTTDGNGDYSFSGLAAGTYRVREAQQNGWVQTTNNPADIIVNTGNTISGVDFGNFRLLTISGTKFNDLDADGIRDNNEPGLSGWVIRLDLGANGSVDQTTTTDGNGNYNFPNVGPGTHRVREVQQNGWVQTTPNPGDIVTISGIDATNVDFGNTRSMSISGQKFNDLDGDGIKDGNEPGVQGVTIQLDRGANGSVERTTSTDSDGNYTFDSLMAGTYRVREVAPGGWVQTTNNPADITLNNGNSVSGVDFGNFRLISISGMKFHDLDADGVKDQGEPGLQGWTIQLDQGANGTVEQSATTDSNGNYSFSNLGPGVYRVREVQQGGWIQSTANPADIIAQSGSNVSGVDFGNHQRTTGEIRGVVFEDLNANGVRDSGEPGLTGHTVFLDLSNNDLLDQTTVTLSSPDVPKAIPDAGTVQSNLAVSGLAGRIADVNVTLRINHTWDEDVDVYLVSPNGTRIELFTDVGGSGDHFFGTTLDDEALQAITGSLAPFTGSFRPEELLSGLDGQDPNGTWILEVSDDAQFDIGTLLNWSLTITAIAEPTTTTNGGGDYAFLSLPPNTYNVLAVIPSGWFQSVPGGPSFKHNVALSAGQTATGRDFGLFRLGEIRGVKYEDLNGNGSRNNNEPGLAGWVIYLDQNDNGVLDGNAVTVNSTDVPKPLPDQTTVNSTLTVAKQSGLILDVNVRLNIAHGNVNHLDVFLVSPNGTRIELFTDVGGNGNNFNNTTLDDEAGSSITAGSAPFNGIFRPEGRLADVDFQDPNGVWTLEVTDDTNGVTGTLNSWSLTITVSTEASTLTDADGAYAFPNLLPGAYNVREQLQPGFVQTEPGGPDFKHKVALSSGQLVTDLNFGNRRQTGGSILDPFGDDPNDADDTQGVSQLLGAAEPSGGPEQNDPVRSAAALTPRTGSARSAGDPAQPAPSLHPEVVEAVFTAATPGQPDNTLVDALFSEEALLSV